MKFEFGLQTNERSELIDITGSVEKFVKQSKVRDGVCIVFIPHTTASICINENADPSVKYDIERALSRIVPQNAGYKHSEGNSDAHIKAGVIGSSRTLIIENNNLLLGTWQGVYFCEFDGPRKRNVVIKIIGS